MKIKFLIFKVALAILLISLGNLFWFSLTDNLNSSRLLTSSSLQVGITLLFPIIIFSLYLSVLVLMSIFIKKRPIWFLIIVLSLVDYPYLIGGRVLATVGELVISATLFYFLITFHGGFTVSKNKASTLGQLSTAFGLPSLIITFVLALNFYNIYTHTLSFNNILLSNQLLAKTLNPVVKVYLDDLQVQNTDEKFADYLERRSRETKLSATQVKAKVMERLNLSEASSSATLKDLIKASLNQSALKIAKYYGKQVPVLISLGLGVITQTLISFSSFIAGYLTIGLLEILRFLKLCKLEKAHLDVTKIVSAE